jgi:hypothetical protein
MHTDGSYVQIVLGARALRGTIHTQINHKDQPQFVFRLDSRFEDKLPDFFVREGEFVECPRPSDAEVAAINALVRAAS